MSFNKYLKFFLLTLFAGFILWFFGRSLDWDAVARSLRQANLTLILISVLIICFGYLLRAFRWRTLLSPISKSDLSTLFEATTIGFAAVFLFGRAGEFVRPLWLPVRDSRVRPTAALVTIGLERICDLTAIVILFVINLLWFRAPQGRESEFEFVNRAGLLLLGFTVVGLTALVAYQRFSPRILKILDRWILRRSWFPTSVAFRIRKILDLLAVSLRILSDPKELFLTTFWTVALWFAISIPTWLVILSFGLSIDFSATLFVMGWAVVGSLVPTPGGAAGAFHTATAAALIFLGVDLSTAAAIAIIMHLVYFGPAIIFGLYYFLRGTVTLSDIRSLTSEANDRDQQTPSMTPAILSQNGEREILESN